MAETPGGNAPDLATVLARLRQFSGTQNATSESQTAINLQPTPPTSQSLQTSYTPGISAANQSSSSTPPQEPRAIPQHPAPESKAASVYKQPHQSVIPLTDPATIIEWVPGLRCVSKMAETNPNFKNSIRKMILEQQHHEKNWWKGREALLERHSMRPAAAQRVSDILKSIGGTVSASSSKPSSSNMQAELDAYDMKVYKAQQEMHKSMTAELKTLGVPFFGMRTDSLVKLKEAELLELQKKMLRHLEDMYGP